MPCCRSEDNLLIVMIGLCLILVYSCVLLIKSCDISPDVCATYGFGTTSEGVYLFFIFFGIVLVLSLMLLEIVALIRIFAQERLVRVICVKGTGKAPELTLPENAIYHMFLSRTLAEIPNASLLPGTSLDAE